MFLFFVRVRHVCWRTRGKRDSGKKKKERNVTTYARKRGEKKERKKEPMKTGEDVVQSLAGYETTS